MICQANDCHRSAHLRSDYCTVHRGKAVSNYIEWDEDHWQDRRDLLCKMWKEEETERQKKRVIADLIVHAHDISK
jgi:hypothetical protein